MMALEEREITIDIMDTIEGHKVEKYRGGDRKRIDELANMIKEKVDNFWSVYGAMIGDELADLKLKTVDEIKKALGKYDRLMLAAPIMGG